MPLSSWINELDYRINRLKEWSNYPPIPRSIYLPLLRNPFRLFACLRHHVSIELKVDDNR